MIDVRKVDVRTSISDARRKLLRILNPIDGARSIHGEIAPYVDGAVFGMYPDIVRTAIAGQASTTFSFIQSSTTYPSMSA